MFDFRQLQVGLGLAVLILCIHPASPFAAGWPLP
jgi:hypothetical protein